MRWLTVRMVTAIHGQAIALTGGRRGVRDGPALAAALKPVEDRGRHLEWAKRPIDPVVFAAGYCVALLRANPFVDGNKRTAYLATNAFLETNGCPMAPAEADIVLIMRGVAAGDLDVYGVAAWLADSLTEAGWQRRRELMAERLLVDPDDPSRTWRLPQTVYADMNDIWDAYPDAPWPDAVRARAEALYDELDESQKARTRGAKEANTRRRR